MSNTISYSIPKEHYDIIKHEASSKGLTPSQFTKVAVFSYINKYPSKGVFSELDKVIIKQ